MSLELLDQDRKISEKSGRPAMFREALTHLDPMRLSMLGAALPDPDVSAAMVRTLRERGRMDEAAAECRSALGRWTAGDVPRVVEACKDCRTPFATNAGAASFPVFRQWLASDDPAYGSGLARGLGRWMSRAKVVSVRRDFEAHAFRREGFGVVIGDPASEAATLARAFEVPFVALAPGAWPRDSTRSAVPVGTRVLVPRPGPNALAARLLEAARKQGARKVLVVQPDEGGDVALAHALERAGLSSVSYVAGRREHRDDARRVRGTGADAVVLLGPAEESADWLPALRSSGAALLVLGTDQLDPAGFHEQARRALEGAIYVRSFWTPVDTSQAEWTETSSSAWIAGWAIGRAIASGADSPRTLAFALEKDLPDQNADNSWLAVPAGVASIEAYRVRNGKAEKLP